MIRIDLTTLRIFLAVYNLQSLTRAAEQEHIAPSAVSKRIQDLELELDAQLFYRHPRGVTATPAGEVLVAHARRIFENVNEMAADLSAYAKGVKGQVRIHAHTSAVVQYLPPEIASFSRRYPEVQVVLREETSPNVLQSTLDGLADIGIFASNMRAPAGLKVLSYRQDQLEALVPAGHPLAEREAIDFLAFRGCAYVSLETGSSLQVLLADAAQAMGFALNTRIEVTTFGAAIQMVEAGLGIAVVPAGIIRTEAQGARVRGIPLTDAWAKRELAICIRDPQKLTAPGRLLLEHLRGTASRSR